MNPAARIPSLVLLMASALAVNAQEPTITVHADRGLHPVSRYLTGACLEDVNHEVYGGIDSQMIFGESFAEPAPPASLKGLFSYGGQWSVSDDGTLKAGGGDGPKLLYSGSAFSNGMTEVELLFPEKGNGNAGLIVKVSDAGNGADHFNGYEITLSPAGRLTLGRHRQNWEPIRTVPCEVPTNTWIKLGAQMTADSLEVLVNGEVITRYQDAEHPLQLGAVGLRTWHQNAQFRNLSLNPGAGPQPVAFIATPTKDDGVSGMWRALRTDTAQGQFSLDRQDPFSGQQSQRVTFVGGKGEIGVENKGLNRRGMNFVKGKTYEGYLCARAEKPTDIYVALENGGGTKVYAEKRLKVITGGWQRLDFVLKPSASDTAGRFSIKLKSPGTVNVGYAFLQPGDWGRFANLPVRRDVAEGLKDQGITVLRYGGSMVNAPEYRWKKMIGPRAQRPPYTGTWYPQSSNGWGIFDFLNFCEAAGFLAIPDLNADETPQDMADFVEYVNGAADSEWGSKRAADGHPHPYHLKHIEIGNEERVNEAYWQKFKAIAEAVWRKDPDIILVVGDFTYKRPFQDPFHFTGADSGITTLEAQQKMLQLAAQHNREVWFDVHVWTEGPRPDFGGTKSYIDALHKLANGANHHVVIFEFNAGNHAQRRALANAAAINWVERDGRLPVATSANCLQPNFCNDNGWDQGLLFLNPSKVWLQPPGYVAQMISRNYEPLLVKTDVEGDRANLDVSAKRSEDGQTLVLQAVNSGDKPVTAKLNLAGFTPRKSTAVVERMAAPLNADNTDVYPDDVVPTVSRWKHRLRNGQTTCELPPRSFTILKFE